MSLNITFSITESKLTVEHSVGNGQSELIVMAAASGGWQGFKPLPAGKWLITENPSGDMGYFGLFFQDGKINDQFRDDKIWRDGIRLGFHQQRGSHGCIMTFPDGIGEKAEYARGQWSRIQELVRGVRSPRIIRYQNNENPARRDTKVYRVRSYGDLIVEG